MLVDVQSVDVDPEVDEEGDAVHVTPGGRQMERCIPVVVALLRHPAATHQQTEGVQVALEGCPSEKKIGRLNLKSAVFRIVI